MPRVRAWIFATAIALLAAAGVAAADGVPGAPPPPASKPPPPPVEEVELTGDAKEAHEKKVKAIVEAMNAENNLEMLRGTTERLGAEKKREGRDALMRFTVGNKNQERITLAYEALGKIGDRKSVEFLCGKTALRSGDFLVQQTAAEVLGKIKSPLAIGPLLDVLTAPSTKIEVMGSAARAAAQSGPRDERVVETIFKLCDTGKDTIRANALEAVGYLGSDKALDRLKDALVHDKNTRCRGAAARGMKNSGRKELIPVLEAAVPAERALTVKDEIARAITELSK